MAESTTIVATVVPSAAGAEPSAEGSGRRRSNMGGEPPLMSGLEGVEFYSQWMVKAVGVPTSGGKEFTYYTVGAEREQWVEDLPKYWRIVNINLTSSAILLFSRSLTAPS